MKFVLAAMIALLTLESLLVESAVINSPMENQAIRYIASVGIGSPPTTYDLIVDTGSSFTWIGANKAYIQTSTSQQTTNTFSLSDGGGVSGNVYTDQVTLADGLVVSTQIIGVANSSTGFNGVDGVLGLGPTDLTIGILSPDTKSAIPTVTDNLFAAGAINNNDVSLSFEPITDSSGSQLNGEATWGGTDSSKYTGEITFVPITTTSPASSYWGFDASLAYGDTTILSTTAGIVDSGTTLLLLASDAFQKYQSATGGVLDQDTGLLTITSDQYTNLHSLFFSIGNTQFEFTANAQIWPRSLNSVIGGTAGHIYLIVKDNGAKSGSGLDFVLGQVFMERFYTVFDTANSRVGIATTPFTTAITN
jgi:cathepsin E